MKKGGKLFEKTKLQISQTLKKKGIKPPSRKGKKLSKEQRKEISQNLKRRYKKHPEIKEQISKKLKGRKKPKGFGEKISKALTGKKCPWSNPPHYRGKNHYKMKRKINKNLLAIKFVFLSLAICPIFWIIATLGILYITLKPKSKYE